MKRFTSLARLFLVCGLALITIGCETTSKKPKKRTPVPPSEDLSGLPWNRPRSYESNAGLGRSMPQSR